MQWSAKAPALAGRASRLAHRGYQAVKTASQRLFQSNKGLTTSATATPTFLSPQRYFASKTYPEMEAMLRKKFGDPRGGGLYNRSFYNPNTGRTFNLHWDPKHRNGKPHVDIRKRGLNNDFYKNRPYYLKDDKIGV